MLSDGPTLLEKGNYVKRRRHFQIWLNEGDLKSKVFSQKDEF